jgi:hypothetical protein
MTGGYEGSQGGDKRSTQPSEDGDDVGVWGLTGGGGMNEAHSHWGTEIMGMYGGSRGAHRGGGG